MLDEDVTMPSDYTVFDIENPDMNATAQSVLSEGILISEGTAAKFDAKIKNAIVRCFGTEAKFGFQDLRRISFKPTKMIAASFSSRRPNPAGGCCEANGSVTDICRAGDFRVVTRIYETSAEYLVTKGVSIDAELAADCKVEHLPSGQLEVGATSGKTISIKASGWNLVELEPLELVCKQLAQ